MTRRKTPLLLPAFAASAALAAGCGGGGGSALEEGLSYVPKDAPVVFTLKTDPESEQYKNVAKIAKKFPFANQAEQQVKQALSSGGTDYEKDIKPLLGNDAVVAIPTAKDLQADDSPTIVALKAKDEDKAKEAVKKGLKKVGEKDGAEIYEGTGGRFTAVQDGTIIGAETRPLLEQAIANKEGDHMSEDDFNERTGDLDKDALVRVGGDMQAILSANPDGGVARKVKWVNALRGFGVTVAAEGDGVKMDFAGKTEGELSDQDLPIASGEQAAPVLRRGGEIGMGIRDASQIVEFAQQASQATDPAGYSRYTKQKQELGQKLGIDVDKDVIQQFTGNSSMSFSLDGKYAFRSEVKDPEALRDTLAKSADELPKVLEEEGDSNVGLAKPKKGEDYYALAEADGEQVVFGVVDKVFVVASDAGRAAQAATQSPSPVAGAKGAVTLGADAEALANTSLRRFGGEQAAGASAFTGPLSDLVGSMKADGEKLTANMKLKVE